MTTEGQSLILRHAPIGWSQDDYDVLAEGVSGRPHLSDASRASGPAVDVDHRLRPPQRSHTNARIRADTRGRDGGVGKELATGMIKKRRIYYEPRVFDGRVIMFDEIERGYTRRCLNSSVSRPCGASW
jgi:hypothetical protein